MEQPICIIGWLYTSEIMNRLTQYMFKIDVEGRLPDSLWLGAKSELEWQFLRMSKNVNVSCLFHRCLW